jgi:hypothetical protein
MLGAKKSRVPGAPRMSMAMRRGRRPLTWGADQGLRLVDSQGRANHKATGVFAALENPAIASYRLRALKVPPVAPRSEPADRAAGVSAMGAVSRT